MGKSNAARVERKRRIPAETGGSAKPAAAALDLNRVIHERIRLGIVSALAVNETLTFNELKALLDTTDGNLSVHARRLEEAEYITQIKSAEERRTEFRITRAGREALERYLAHMEALISAVRR